MIIALIIAIPIIVFPAIFIWYINVSGIYQVAKDRKAREKRKAAYQVI